LELELAEDSFILISGIEALKKSVFPAPNYAKVRVMVVVIPIVIVIPYYSK
jgi:hypothetical protein